MFDLAVIGAGPAGLSAAISAASEGLSVALIDNNSILGRKILSTGNGRCNFTNSKMNSSFFYATDKGFVDAVLDAYGSEEILSFFVKLGVFYREIDGYYYPVTNSAATVQKAFENEIKSYDNIKVYEANVKTIDKSDNIKLTFTNGSHVSSRYLILATGGLAKASLGNNKDGLKMAASLGHKIAEPKPALVNLYSNDKRLQKLAKIRTYGKASLVVDSRVVKEDTGEIQFTKDYISGIPVMQLSGYAKAGCKLLIDLVPYLTEDKLKAELIRRLKSGNNTLNGLINIKIEEAVFPMGLNTNNIDETVSNLKKLTFTITHPGSFEEAQVMRGGVDITEINPYTMESRIVKNVFFAGEIMDVDGMCGGYNITFAMATGFIAALGVISSAEGR